jgi:hypothetical protein
VRSSIFGGGLAVRNLCRQRLKGDELAACGGFGADWDNCYIGCSPQSLRGDSNFRL